MSDTPQTTDLPVYRAPTWCGYPPQPDGSVFCYSLLLGRVTGEAYCRVNSCDAAKDENTNG
jgi:hypothetical protein